ncbi:MAG TPA: hypothetical protein VFT70_06290 [Nocardioides sp.]|nr:hypothetical protein [Nocardioides sp.]
MSQEDPAPAGRGRRALRIARTVALAALLATVPFATALVAIGHAPPAHVQIAGQQVSVRPVLGQDTSRLFQGALVRPQHQRLAGKPVGVNIDADWNRLVPSDKPTRRYLAGLWENPRPAIHLIGVTARQHLLIWGFGGFLAGVLAVGAVVGLSWQRRRRLASYSPEQAALVSRHNRRLRVTLVAAGVVVALALDAVAATVWMHDDHRTPVASPVFRGTPLEGTQVTGLVADVLPFLSVLRPRSQFYEDVSANLKDALAAQPELAGGEDDVVFVLADDFEDVNGMARQVGLTARLLDADFVALTGDLTFAGKRLELYVLDTLDYYAEDRPIHLAPGLHDTRTIVAAAEERGWEVGDGTTQDVAGLRLLAAADPRISTVGNFGSDDVLRDPAVDVDEFVSRTIDRACTDRPDFVLVHDHLLGRRIAESGCVGTAVLDGRSFDFLGPQQVQTATDVAATEFTLGSAGGHVSTKPNPGIITSPARFAIMYVDPDTRGTRYAVVTVTPDASVTVTPPVALNTPKELAAPATSGARPCSGAARC